MLCIRSNPSVFFQQNLYKEYLEQTVSEHDLWWRIWPQPNLYERSDLSTTRSQSNFSGGFFKKNARINFSITYFRDILTLYFANDQIILIVKDNRQATRSRKNLNLVNWNKMLSPEINKLFLANFVINLLEVAH